MYCNLLHLCMVSWWLISLQFMYSHINNLTWKVHSWHRKCVVLQLVSSGQWLTSVSRTWLFAEGACVRCSIHCVLGQQRLFTPLHYLFLVFHIFNIIEKLCWGIPHWQTEMSHLYCHGKQSRCWKYLFPVAVVGWVHPSPPARLPPFMSSALCSRDSKHFLTCSYGKCVIYKSDHLSACALHLG